MELQQVWPELKAAGVALFGLSYDSVAVLAEFASKRGITFPLLSDEGSHVIRALGLLNEHVAEQHAYYGVAVRDEHHDVPYPGTFVLDENGVVTGKYFEQSYRVRPTAALFREMALGLPGQPAVPVTAVDEQLQIHAWTDAQTYRPYQQLRLLVQLVVPTGMHVFAAPTPAGYTSLNVEVEPLEGLTVGVLQTAAAQPLQVPAVDERVMVYTDTVDLMLPLLFTKNVGPTTLQVRVTYQGCSATLCFPPRTTTLRIDLQGQDLIRD